MNRNDYGAGRDRGYDDQRWRNRSGQRYGDGEYYANEGDDWRARSGTTGGMRYGESWQGERGEPGDRWYRGQEGSRGYPGYGGYAANNEPWRTGYPRTGGGGETWRNDENWRTYGQGGNESWQQDYGRDQYREPWQGRGGERSMTNTQGYYEGYGPRGSYEPYGSYGGQSGSELYGRSSAGGSSGSTGTMGNRGNERGPHTGRGPRGYHRSDDRISEEVCDRLEQHGWMDASELNVEVHNGEVSLKGDVDSRQQKRLAEDIAEGVAGVKDVHNELRVHEHQGGGQNQSTTSAQTNAQQGTQQNNRVAGRT